MALLHLESTAALHCSSSLGGDSAVILQWRDPWIVGQVPPLPLITPPCASPCAPPNQGQLWHTSFHSLIPSSPMAIPRAPCGPSSLQGWRVIYPPRHRAPITRECPAPPCGPSLPHPSPKTSVWHYTYLPGIHCTPEHPDFPGQNRHVQTDE